MTYKQALQMGRKVGASRAQGLRIKSCLDSDTIRNRRALFS